jgi:hypothetical protein
MAWRSTSRAAEATSFEIPHMQPTVFEAGKRFFLFLFLFVCLTFGSAFDRPRPTWVWFSKRFGFISRLGNTVNDYKQCHAGVPPLKSTATRTKTTCLHQRMFGSYQSLTASTASKRMTTAPAEVPPRIPIAAIPARKMTTPTFNSWVIKTLHLCLHLK